MGSFPVGRTMEGYLSSQGDIAVSPADDWLSGLVERRGPFFCKLGNLETRTAADTFSVTEVVRPIYISGLARSGSTILLELLAGHPDTATHQYRDFPMIFTPLWWNWFLERASKGDDAPFERAHKDRIVVTRNSPEAIEEMLWMHFFPHCHDPAVPNVLDATIANPAFEKFYREHLLKMLALRKGRRYLAKGNYNLSRIGYLHWMFADACFVVPVRDPVNHIASLLKQHTLFVGLERDDIRVLNYMRRVGHFEFGLDRRPLNLGNSDQTREILRLWEAGEEVRGMARYWASVYDHVADVVEQDATLRQAVLLVHYDDLCADAGRILQQVYAHVALPVSDETLKEQAAVLSPPDYYKPPFGDADLAVIEAETAATHARIRRLCC